MPNKLNILIILIFCFLLLPAETVFANQNANDNRDHDNKDHFNQDQALIYYHQGISAKTVGQREEAFEKALEIYLSIFNRMKREGKMNGLLCYNIGNCYFNLKQTGEAIFYYKTGLKLLPGDENIIDNLKTALQKREYAVDIKHGGIKEVLLFFHYKIGTAMRINILIGFSIVSALLLIALIYRKRTSILYVAGMLCACVFCLSISLCVEYYLPSNTGITVHSAEVRKDAGEGFAMITPKPLGEGSSIRVLSFNNGWYKVKLNDGRKGFVRQNHLSLVL
jgi:tetratricopeptide (TPR) repeat protein